MSKHLVQHHIRVRSSIGAFVWFRKRVCTFWRNNSVSSASLLSGEAVSNELLPVAITGDHLILALPVGDLARSSLSKRVNVWGRVSDFLKRRRRCCERASLETQRMQSMSESLQDLETPTTRRVKHTFGIAVGSSSSMASVVSIDATNSFEPP